MLLAVDIGNTNIVCALFDSDTVVHQWRIYTDPRRTGDEYFSILLSLFRDTGVDVTEIESAAVSSVVPALIGPFITVCQQLIGKKPLLLSPAVYDRLPVHVPESAVHEIGTDLLCDALAAWNRYKSACITVDFGTALSFTAVDNNAYIAGVAIAPGLGTALKALFSNTAQLPSVPLEAPPSSLGTNTTHSIQAGIVLGYRSLVEGLVQQMKNDMEKQYGIPQNEIHVIATGGLNTVLQPITSVFEVYDRQLTLDGLRLAALCCSKNED